LPKFVSAISNFISSTKSSVKWISRDGQFSKYFEKMTAWVVPGIQGIPDCMTALRTMVESTIFDYPETIINQLSVLLFSHKNTSGWKKHNLVFNSSTGGQARSLTFLHIFDESGYVDLAYCSINATFQTLGDIELVTTNQEYFGGLFSGSSTIKKTVYPPNWTKNDTITLDDYFSLMCQKYFAQILNLPPIHVPPFPIHD